MLLSKKLIRLFLSIFIFVAVPTFADVSALGRLEPRNGVFHITSPIITEAGNGAVLQTLHVAPGDEVEAGQLLAVMESFDLLESLRDQAIAAHHAALKDTGASEASADAECVRADVTRREADRRQSLLEQNLSSQEEAERASADATFQTAACRASRISAEAMSSRAVLAQSRLSVRTKSLARASVYAPIKGRVLDVHTWPGESIGLSGILELGETSNMYAVAEVYETDIYKVQVGQSASISSAALPNVIVGTVERVRPLVRKQDVTGTDPAARKDARVVEVEIKLDKMKPDEAKLVAALTNLQVEVVIEN
jgi:HlyD family secretion protein